MKVAIIGGGICGLYLAKKLANKGHQIAVFEKKKEIGNNVCSGLFSLRILELIPESENLIERKIKSVKIHFPKKTTEVFFTKDFLLISHSKLDNLAARLAQQAGVKIILNSNMQQMPVGFERIIGCDGYDSFVRKNLNMPKLELKLGIQSFVNEENNNDYVEVWPKTSGFVWKIPRGAETEYGVMAKPFTASWFLRDFLKNKIILSTKSKLIPAGFSIPLNDKITLCGDSAGMTKPWSGGGVIWGLKSADILVDNFPNFIKYKQRADSFFKKKEIISKIATKTIYFTGFNLPFLIPSKNKIESDFLF